MAINRLQAILIADRICHNNLLLNFVELSSMNRTIGDLIRKQFIDDNQQHSIRYFYHSTNKELQQHGQQQMVLPLKNSFQLEFATIQPRYREIFANSLNIESRLARCHEYVDLFSFVNPNFVVTQDMIDCKTTKRIVTQYNSILQRAQYSCDNFQQSIVDKIEGMSKTELGKCFPLLRKIQLEIFSNRYTVHLHPTYSKQQNVLVAELANYSMKKTG